MLFKKYFTIGEVAELIDVPPHVIRFWEKNFSIIVPQKARGRRYYNKNDINSLSLIKKMLYVEKISIKAAQNIFGCKITGSKKGILQTSIGETENIENSKSVVDDLLIKLSQAKNTLSNLLNTNYQQ